jgi:hypothetical protein
MDADPTPPSERSMSVRMKNYLSHFNLQCCRFLYWSLLALALSSCRGASIRDPLIVSLTPDRDIVVVDGQSVQFTVAVVDAAKIDRFSWSRFPALGTDEPLSVLRTATVSIPFSLKDDGASISVIASATDGQIDSAAIKPIKVIQKMA